MIGCLEFIENASLLSLAFTLYFQFIYHGDTDYMEKHGVLSIWISIPSVILCALCASVVIFS